MGDKSRSRDPLGQSALKKPKTTACCKYDKFTTDLNELVESSVARRNAQQTDFTDFERYKPKAGFAASKQDPRVSREDLASSVAAHNMEGEQNIAVAEAQNKTTKRQFPIVWAPNAKSLPIRLPAHKLEQALKRQKRSKHETEPLEQQELPHKAEKERKSEEQPKTKRLRVQHDRAEKAAQSRTRCERERAQQKTAAKRRQRAAQAGRKQHQKAVDSFAVLNLQEEAKDAAPQSPSGNANAADLNSQADSKSDRKLSKAAKKAKRRIESEKAAQIRNQSQLRLETKHGSLVGLSGPPLPPGAILPTNEVLPPRHSPFELQRRSEISKQFTRTKWHTASCSRQLNEQLAFPPGFSPDDPKPWPVLWDMQTCHRRAYRLKLDNIHAFTIDWTDLIDDVSSGLHT